MKAFGSTIDCLMNAGSLPLSTLSRSGPVVPVAPASASVWQPLQPLEVNSCLPLGAGAAPPPAGTGLPPLLSLFSQAVKACGETTCALARIVEWPSPHSSAQTIEKSPSLIVLTRYFV